MIFSGLYSSAGEFRRFWKKEVQEKSFKNIRKPIWRQWIYFYNNYDSIYLSQVLEIQKFMQKTINDKKKN